MISEDTGEGGGAFSEGEVSGEDTDQESSCNQDFLVNDFDNYWGQTQNQWGQYPGQYQPYNYWGPPQNMFPQSMSMPAQSMSMPGWGYTGRSHTMGSVPGASPAPPSPPPKDPKPKPSDKSVQQAPEKEEGDDCFEDDEPPEEEVGPSLGEKLTSKANKRWAEDRDVKQLYSKHKRPEGVDVSPTDVNQELLSVLKGPALEREKGLRKAQSSLAKGTYPLLRMVKLVAGLKAVDKTERKEMVNLGMEALEHFSHANQLR